MERLTLPHAAHALWMRVEQPLSLALRHLRTAGVQWSLGGGTVMAARWLHRRSNDIDLTVPQGSEIHALSDEASGFPAQMMAAGARRTALGTRHHVIEFSGTTGSLEITEMDLRPAGGATLMRCGTSEISIRAATSGGGRHTVRATPETFRDTLEASGLDEYLRSGHVGIGGGREQIDDLATGRIPGPIVVSSI